MVVKLFGSIISYIVVRMIVALALVGAISAASLVFVYKYSIPKIRVNTRRATEEAIKDIFPGTAKIDKTGKNGDIFKVTGGKGDLMGYAFIAEGNGYQGEIQLICGVDPKMTKMHGMAVLESQETPGLGAEIASDHFRAQFNGLSITHPIEYVKNEKPTQPYQIEAITGATISSRAVVNIINKRMKEVTKELK